LGAAAESEGGVGLAGGKDLVEALDDGVEGFATGEMIGDVFGAAFYLGMVG
jgi:hypothetical protein